MNVAIISGTLPDLKCGVGDYTYWLCSDLRNHVVKISIITSQDENIEIIKEVSVYPVIKKWNFSSLPLLIRSLKKISPDLVHLQYPTQNYKNKLMINFFPLFFKALFFRIPLIITIHDMKTAHPLNKLRLIPFFIFADKLIVTAKEEKDYLARKLPFVNPKLRIIPLGSNIQVRAISESEKERIRLNFGATKNDILVSHFGYMLPNKKIEILLHAFKHLLDNGLCAKLMMISDFSPLNNRYHAQLKKIADELSLNKFIIWTGYLNPETVSKYLSASDINIQLYADGVSYRRGSLLAALSHGLAIITNAAGELPEGLIDHYNVLAFTLKNPQELVTAFKELAESKALREKISNNAKDLAKKFSWENIAKEHFELYESLYVRAAKNASFITRTYKVRRSV